MFYAMLTVDLNDATDSAARQVFATYLLEHKWLRLKLTTTFTAEFNEGVSAASALTEIKHDVEGAARKAQVSNYEVAVQLGETPLEQWKQP